MPNNQEKGRQGQKQGQGGMQSPGKTGTQKPGESKTSGQTQKDKDKMSGQSSSHQQGSQGNKPSY